MLVRKNDPSGVVFYASPQLEAIGVPHAFSTRLGGTSAAPFESLNLGNPNGCAIQDDRPNIAENYRRLFAAIGCEGRHWCRVHQVHENRAVVALDRAFDPSIKADAIVTQSVDCVATVRVADCVPILLASDDGRTVAAVHAGWRGVISGIAESAVRLMCESASITADRLIAAIGPCISRESFEVGPEVIAEFRRVFGDDAPLDERLDGKGHVDLREAIRLQIERLGIARIDTTDCCTHRDADEFFSHRREKGVTGRLAAAISPVTPS